MGAHRGDGGLGSRKDLDPSGLHPISATPVPTTVPDAVLDHAHTLQRQQRAPLRGLTQKILGPSLKGEQEQSGNDCLDADCAAQIGQLHCVHSLRRQPGSALLECVAVGAHF